MDSFISINDRIISHPVSLRRQSRQWSQAELARRVGVSRAAISAIEGRRLSPSVSTALALASVFECSVEELFSGDSPRASGTAEWAWTPRGQSVRYWEAEVGRRRFIYPVEGLASNAAPHDGVCIGGVFRDRGRAPAERTLTLACCDPAAGLLAAEYARASGYRLLVFPRGGRVALELLRRGVVHVAGLHYSTREQPERNVEIARAEFKAESRLVCHAQWDAGIALAPDDRSRSAQSIAKGSLRWAAREPGSAAREHLDELLGARGFKGREVGGHAAVAEAIRAGWAQAGVCVRLSAAEAGLNFLPLRTETLQLCFPAAMERDARIQALIRLLRDREYRRLLSELPGYDARQTGELSSISAD